MLNFAHHFYPISGHCSRALILIEVTVKLMSNVVCSEMLFLSDYCIAKCTLVNLCNNRFQKLGHIPSDFTDTCPYLEQTNLFIIENKVSVSLNLLAFPADIDREPTSPARENRQRVHAGENRLCR